MITSEIIKELAEIKNTNEVTRKPVLAWARRPEVQRLQKTMLDSIQDSKEFDMIS